MKKFPGRTNIVTELINNNAVNIDMIGKSGKTALQEAVETNRENIVKMLIEKGANVTIKDKKGQSLLHIAAAKGIFLEKIDTFFNLIEAKKNFNPQKIFWNHKCYQLLPIFTEMNSSINPFIYQFQLSTLGYQNLVEIFIENDGIDVNQASDDGSTALEVAVNNGDFNFLIFSGNNN